MGSFLRTRPRANGPVTLDLRAEIRYNSTDIDIRKGRWIMLNQLFAYYDAYERELLEKYAKASPFAGVLGMGNHPKDDPCNEVFYHNVENWTRKFLAGTPSQQEAEVAANWMLKLAQVHRDDKTCMFCYAIQSHATGLIPLMGREQALQLQKWYDNAYPSRERLPIQREVYKALEKRSGQPGPKKRGLFSRT